MRPRRAVVVGGLSVCLVGTFGVGEALAATSGSGGQGGSATSPGPLSGLVNAVGGLIGHGHRGQSDPPAPSDPPGGGPLGILPGPSASPDPLGDILPSGVPTNPSGLTRHLPSLPSASGNPQPSGSLPSLPSPGNSLPDHLCLPQQLRSTLPSSIPGCLNLTECKRGLVRDLEELPRVKLTRLAQYAQRVLGDIPACLASLLPAAPSATPTATPAQSVRQTPASFTHLPAPRRAPPAKPVREQPNFTG